jgi:hypothetical protein
MYLPLTPNLLYFLPDLYALYALRPTFMKFTPTQALLLHYRRIVYPNTFLIFFSFVEVVGKLDGGFLSAQNNSILIFQLSRFGPW